MKGDIVDAPCVAVARYEIDGTATLRGAFPAPEPPFRTTTRVSLERDTVLGWELDPLSEPDRDVLHLLALGYTNQEIGQRLYISVRTVDSHRAPIIRKLCLEPRAELVFFALPNGLIGAA